MHRIVTIPLLLFPIGLGLYWLNNTFVKAILEGKAIVFSRSGGSYLITYEEGATFFIGHVALMTALGALFVVYPLLLIKNSYKQKPTKK